MTNIYSKNIWRCILSIVIIGLSLLLTRPRTVFADGPATKTFAYNYVDEDELSQEIFIPYLAKNYKGWTSTLVVANSQSITTRLTIDIFSATGQVTSLPPVDLPPFGVRLFDLATDEGLDNLDDGRYQAHIGSDATMITAEVHTESGYMAMSYTDIGAVGQGLTIPIIEKRADDWNTTFYVHNTETFSAKISITYYGLDSPVPVHNVTHTVPPLQSLEFETLSEPQLPDNFSGYAQITTDPPRVIGAVVLRENFIQESAMTFPAVDFYDAGLRAIALTSSKTVALDWFIPVFTREHPAKGSSILQVQNTGFTTANYVLIFYNLDGTVFTTKIFTIPPRETARYDHTDFSFGGFKGSAALSSDQAFWAAISQQRPAEAGDLFGYHTGFFESTTLHFPYLSRPATSEGWRTKIIVQNTGASAQNITLNFYSTDGTNYPRILSNVARFVSVEVNLDQVVPAGFQGQAVVTGSDKLTGVVIGEKPHATGNHARVVKNGLPRPGAAIFYQGQSQGLTDAEGLLPLGNLEVGLPLIALDPVKKVNTSRQAHDGWAYQIYTTNIVVNNDGSTTPTYKVPAPGRQILTTSETNPLVLFNIVVSVEWDATDDYLTMLEDAFRKASAYLYDVTDGQMAFSQVTIYDKGEHWADADFQFSAKNTVRPYAFVGGVTSQDEAHSIRLGRGWDRSGGDGLWNKPDGFRTIIHEFGHYALFLYDEYIGFNFNDEGEFENEIEPACTSTLIKNPQSDAATNASIMYWQYNASELADKTAWTEDCQKTEQHSANNGEADWETVLRKYSGPGWQLNTPGQTVMAGPDQFPTNLLPFPHIDLPSLGNGGGVTRRVQVSANGQPAHNALVALYTQFEANGPSLAIDQGLTDAYGDIQVLGARPGDVIRVATFDGGQNGTQTVNTQTSYDLALTPTANQAGAQSAGQPPYLILIPTAAGDELFLEVHDVPSGTPDLQALVIPGQGAGLPQSPILANTGGQIYTNKVAFSGAGLGTGRIRIFGLPSPIDSDYNLQTVSELTGTTLYSEDGNFELLIPPGGTWVANAHSTVIPTGNVPGTLPPGKTVAGSAYQVRISGAQTTLKKRGLVRLHYHPEVMGQFNDMSIFYWNTNQNAWEPLPEATFNVVDQAWSAPTSRLGIYALMGTSLPNSIYFPLIYKP